MSFWHMGFPEWLKYELGLKLHPSALLPPLSGKAEQQAWSKPSPSSLNISIPAGVWGPSSSSRTFKGYTCLYTA